MQQPSILKSLPPLLPFFFSLRKSRQRPAGTTHQDSNDMLRRHLISNAEWWQSFGAYYIIIPYRAARCLSNWRVCAGLQQGPTTRSAGMDGWMAKDSLSYSLLSWRWQVSLNTHRDYIGALGLVYTRLKPHVTRLFSMQCLLLFFYSYDPICWRSLFWLLIAQSTRSAKPTANRCRMRRIKNKGNTERGWWEWVYVNSRAT